MLLQVPKYDKILENIIKSLAQSPQASSISISMHQQHHL